MKHPWGLLVVFAAVLLLYAIVKLYALHPVVGDENIYFYQGWRMSAGLRPYRDFASAHPPLHLYVLAATAMVSRGTLLAFKIVPMLFTLGTGLCVFALARCPRFRLRFGGAWWGMLVMAVFLLSFDTLRISNRATGTNQATFFLTLGFLLFVRGQPRLAGICYAAALATGIYVIPVLACLVGFGWAELRAERRSRDWLWLFASLIGALIAFHVPTWVTAWREWWQQTVWFHVRKPAIGPDFGYTLKQFTAAEGSQAVACALALVLLMIRRDRSRDMWLPMAGLSFLMLGLVTKRVYIYYWFPSFPFLALGTGLFLHEMWGWLWERTDWRRWAAVGLTGLCLVVQPVWYGMLSVRVSGWGATPRHDFHPTPAIGPINRLVAALFPAQVPGWMPVPGFVRALWHESRFWQNADALATEVARTLTVEETLYGDSTTTPLLALLAQRRIAGERADSNTMQFRTGLRTVADDLRAAQRDGLRLLVAQPRRGVYLLPEFAEFVNREAILWRQEDTGNGLVMLFLTRPPSATNATAPNR